MVLGENCMGSYCWVLWTALIGTHAHTHSFTLSLSEPESSFPQNALLGLPSQIFSSLRSSGGVEMAQVLLHSLDLAEK